LPKFADKGTSTITAFDLAYWYARNTEVFLDHAGATTGIATMHARQNHNNAQIAAGGEGLHALR
jgi:hypothetical protein